MGGGQLWALAGKMAYQFVCKKIRFNIVSGGAFYRLYTHLLTTEE